MTYGYNLPHNDTPFKLLAQLVPGEIHTVFAIKITNKVQSSEWKVYNLGFALSRRQRDVKATTHSFYQTPPTMFVSFVLCSVLILSASVNAACPPLGPSRSEPTFLEQLAKTDSL